MTTNVRVTALAAPLSPSRATSTRRRRVLLTSTALVGSALVGSGLLAPNAHAQDILPNVANAGSAIIATNGPAGSQTLDVNLNGASRVIDFTNYNVGANNAVNYSTSVASATQLVAVNRVLSGGGLSLIDGAINADAGISVWLINQDGITYNGSATFGGGSLMLSTLDFSSTVNGAFRTAFAVAGAAEGASYNFAGPGNGAIAINTGGANFAINGSIVAVSPTITTGGALTASNGSVVLVAGTDVTFTAGLGNPLSFTVNAGTPIGGGVTVNDDLTGQSVVLAGGLQNNLTATLLNVNAGANLTATAANGAVVLATATTTYGTNTATIANGANAEPSIRNAGNLAATGANGDVVINSAHDITGNGGGTAQRNLTIDAVRDINVSGNYVATTGSIAASAGRDGTFAGLTGFTDVAVITVDDATTTGTSEATTGDLSFFVGGNAVLGALVAGNDIRLEVGGNTTLGGNANAGQDYLVETNDYTQTSAVVAVRNVNLSIANDALVTGSIEATNGDLIATVGRDATFAQLTAGNDVDIDIDRDGTFNGLLTAGNDVLLAAGLAPAAPQGTLTVNGSVDADRDFYAEGLVVRLGAIGQTRTQSAGRFANIHSTTGNIEGRGTLTLESGGGANVFLTADNGVVNFDRLTTTVDAGLGDVVVTSAPTITLGNVTAANLYTAGDTRLTATGAIRTGNLTIDNRLVIYSTNGLVQTGNVDVNTLGQTLEIYADGANGDITTGNLRTNRGDIYVSAFRDATVGNVSTALNDPANAPVAGSIGLLAGRDLSAGNLTAGVDVFTRSGGASIITSATAGDDVTLFANGNFTVTNATVLGTAPDTSSLSTGGAGAPGSIVPTLEDLSLLGHQLRLGSLNQITSTGLLQNLGLGDAIIEATGLIDLNLVTANTGTALIRVTSTGSSVLANSLTAASLVDVDAFADATIGFASAGVIDIDAGADASLGIGEAGSLITIDAGDDVGSATRLVTTNGDIFLNATDAVAVNRVEAGGTGSVGVLAGGTVQATTLIAARDVAVLGGTAGAPTPTNVTVGNASAGDDIDLVALNGNLSLATGAANATPGTGGSAVAFTGLPGTPGAVGTGGLEDAQAAQSIIRLRSEAGDVSSAAQLTTANGDVIVNAFRDVSLNGVTASGAISGGSIAVRAGRDVTGAANLVSTSEDVSIGATGNIALGNVTAADDIDLLAGGRITGTQLTLTGGPDRTRFADVTTGSAGAVGGVTFTTPDDADLAAANIVRIRAADVGNGAPGPVGLIVDTVLNSADFDAQAVTGDVRLGDITSVGDISVVADNGSVTGLPNGYAPVTGLGIAGADTVNINVTGTAIFGTISADTVRTVVNPNTLRIGQINANTVDFIAVDTIDIGSIDATGSIDLQTTGGTALATQLEILTPGGQLASGFGDASLTTTGSDRQILVRAENGVAQLGSLVAGSGAGIGGFDQISVTARAMTVTRADALDANLSLLATDGLLRLSEGFAAQHATLIKRNDDGVSAGSDTTTDILDVLDVAVAGTTRTGLTAGWGIDVSSETSATVARALAIGANPFDRDLAISAFRNAKLDSGEATLGSIGIHAGGSVTGGTAPSGVLVAGQDIRIQAGSSITVNTARAGDDIDFFSAAGDVRLDNGTALGTLSDLSSVDFSGTPGQPGTVSVVGGEDAVLAGLSTIRLRSANGAVLSNGLIETQGAGHVIANAATNAALLDVTARNGSIGVLAGQAVTARNLLSSADIRVQARTSATITSATADDDIDVATLNGNLTLTNATSTGSNENATAVTFGTAGALDAVGFSGVEDADFATTSSIRLTSAGSGNRDIVSAGTLLAQGRGDVLVNAGGAAALTDVRAANGSIGIVSGFVTGANSLVASRDIAVEGGGGILIGTADAGDDIDMVALFNTMELTDGTARGTAIASGTSVLVGGDGRMHVVAGEDASLANLSTIRLRARSGNLRSTGTLTTLAAGDILLTASVDGFLNVADARNGSIGVLVGRDITANGPSSAFTASRDVRVEAARNAFLRTVTAGDDIDVLAGNRLALRTGTSLGTAGSDGTSVVFGIPGGATGVTVVTGGEDTQLAGRSTIRLRAANGDIAGDFGTVPATGATLSAAAGDIIVNTSQSINLVSATATTGSVGLLAGGAIEANALVAGIDAGVRGGGNVTINTATAGDDIDIASLGGSLVLTSATSTATTSGRSVDFTAAGSEGTAGAVTFGSVEAPDFATTSSIRLRSEQLQVSSTGTLRSQGGNVLVNAATDAVLSVVDASGSVGILAGGDASANLVTAGGDVAVRAGRDAALVQVDAGDDIDVVAARDLALLQGTTANSAGTTRVAFTGVAGAAGALGVVTGEDAQLSRSTIRLVALQGNVAGALGASPAGTTLTAADGEILVNALRNVTVASATATRGSVGLLAGDAIAATNLVAGTDIAVRGGTVGAAATSVTIGTATAGDDLDVVALNGLLTITDGTSTGLGAGGTSVDFGTPAGINAVGIVATEDADLAANATIRLRAQNGNVTSVTSLRTQGSGNILVNASGSAALNTATASGGSIAVLAGTTVTAATLTASRDVAVKGGTGVTITQASAGDDIDALAVTGTLTVTDAGSTGTAAAGGNGAVFSATLAAGAAGAATVASGEEADFAGSSTLRLRAAAGNVTSTGTLRTQGPGNVLVNAAQNASLGTAEALQGSVGVLAGNDLTAGTLAASRDVYATATRDALIATATAGDDIDVLAGNNLTLTTGTSNGTATGGSIVFGTAGADRAVSVDTAEGAPFAASTIRLRATNGSITGLPASGAAGATLTAAKGDILATAKQTVTIRKASALDTAATRAITVEAADVVVNGLVETSATTGTVTLRNNGTNATVVGDSAITTGTVFGVSDTELGLLHGKTVVVDSGAKALELAKITVLADTGASDVRFLGSGDVEITNVITVAGTATRTLQIGGVLGALSDDATGETLAKTIFARIDRASRPKILAGSSTVELRGEKIVFGTTAMVDEFRNLDATAIAAQVSNPGSKLYGTTDPAASLVTDPFLVAKQVTVGYRNFALFQNTQPSGYRGVVINSELGKVPTQTELALRLISTGDTGPNSFSMFGVVNGFIGTSAALLGNQAVQISNPAGDPNQVRITRASSRLNGCIIGAPDKGCLATDIPQPQFDLYDERVVALFDADDESTISVSPLIGRGNDGLIVNVADAPVNIDTIECRPEDPNCPAKEGE